MSRRGWALFLAMGFIWGVPYLLIKVAVEEISPSTLVLARTALASLVSSLGADGGETRDAVLSLAANLDSPDERSELLAAMIGDQAIHCEPGSVRRGL